MAEQSWDTVVVPILEAIAGHEGEFGVLLDSADLADQLDLDHAPVAAELQRLVGSGHIETVNLDLGRSSVMLVDPRLGEKGARAIGKWPSADPFDALVAVLDQRLLDPDLDEETKTNLARVRKTLLDVGKTTIGGVLTAYARHLLGLP